jgi:prophage regulatory protein
MSQQNRSTEPKELMPDGFSRIKTVAQLAAASRSSIWRWVSEGRFPQPVKIGPGCTAWRNSDLLAWSSDPINWQEFRDLVSAAEEE